MTNNQYDTPLAGDVARAGQQKARHAPHGAGFYSGRVILPKST